MESNIVFEGGKAIVSAEAILKDGPMVGGGSRRRFPRSQGIPLGLYKSSKGRTAATTWQGGSVNIATCPDDVFQGFF